MVAFVLQGERGPGPVQIFFSFSIPCRPTARMGVWTFPACLTSAVGSCSDKSEGEKLTILYSVYYWWHSISQPHSYCNTFRRLARLCYSSKSKDFGLCICVCIFISLFMSKRLWTLLKACTDWNTACGSSLWTAIIAYHLLKQIKKFNFVFLSKCVHSLLWMWE